MRQKLAVNPITFMAATATALVMVILLIIAGSWGLPEEAEPPMEPLPSVITGGTLKGSPDAPITIVEFSDFQCHFCQEFASTTLRKLESTYIQTGKVRLLHRHYPDRGEESMLAALASECAAEQGKFWPYYDLLMAARPSPEEIDLTRERLEGFASELGLDINQFNASLDSEKYRGKIIQDYNLGKELGVRGIPVFFVDGVRVVGAQPFEVFQNIIEKMLGELEK